MNLRKFGTDYFFCVNQECHVQNTAREYIKVYSRVAKSAESFGEVPE